MPVSSTVKNCQQTFGDGLAAFPFLPGQGHGLIALAEAMVQIQRGYQATGGNAQNGSRGSHGIVICKLQHHNGSAQAQRQLADCLQHLGHGSGHHIALTLEETPVCAHQADQETRRTQGRNGHPRITVVHSARQQLAAENHQQRAAQAKAEENGPCHGVDLAHLLVLLQGAGLGDHAAHGHRQAGGGDQQQQRIDLVGGGVKAEAVISDDGLQRNGIKRTDDLNKRSRQGKQGRAVQKGLFFHRIRHNRLL